MRALVYLNFDKSTPISKIELVDKLESLNEEIAEVKRKIKELPSNSVHLYLITFEELIENRIKLEALIDSWDEMFYSNGGAKRFDESGPRIDSGYLLYLDEKGNLVYPNDPIQVQLAVNSKMI